MQSNKRENLGVPWFSAIFASCFMVSGCASTSTSVKMESRALAKKLGVQGCRVSVPLTQLEVIEDAKRMGNPQPENDQDWLVITKSIQGGDELRLVNCLSSRSTFFYVLIRDGVIIREFHSSLFD
jgi:hypothetical protein